VPGDKAMTTPSITPSQAAASPLPTKDVLKTSDNGYIEAAPFLKNVLRVNEGTLDTLKLEGCSGSGALALPSP
jgi:hypothetical protein